MTERYGSLTLQLKNLSDLSNIGSTYTDVLIDASGPQKLNAIGRGSFTFARHATLYAACIANVGQVAYVYVTDQVASGAAMDVATFIIEEVTTSIDGVMTTTVSGPGIEDQLAFANLSDDTIDDGAGGRDTTSIADIMAYAPSGWTHNGTETVKGTYHVSRGDTVFKTLVDAAKQSGEFFRLSSYSAPAKQINWYQSADSSGVTLRMPTDPTTYDGSATVGIITNMSLSNDFAPTLSGVRPYGSGLEDGRLDITDIDAGDTGADPAGYTTTFATNTIVNNTLESSLGYEKHEDVDFPHIKVEDPTNATHLVTAAVALWDEAIYYLQQRDTTRKYYNIDCVVPYDLRPGQTVTVVYSEYEGGTAGGAQILNINSTFKILNVTNSFGTSTKGVRKTKLVVSDDIVTRPEAVHYIRAAMEKTQATTRKTNVGTSPGGVPSSRTISTSAPLTGGGDLSANRTFQLGTLSGYGAANSVYGVTSGGTNVENKAFVNGTGINITHGVGTITVTNTTSHAQVHVLATSSALGPDHTVSGLTTGHVLKALSATTAAFGQLLHSQLGSVGVNDHHNQVHSITGSDHTITASQYQLVGATATNTLGLLTPSSDVTAAAILISDANGRLGLEGLGINTAADGDYVKIVGNGSTPALVINAGAEGEIATEDGAAIRWGHWDGVSTFTERMVLDSGGKFLIGDSANTGMTIGVTINQGANDDEAVALKSSDIAHGITTYAETDTYGTLFKANATLGGLTMRGLTEDIQAIQIQGMATNTDATDTSSSRATVRVMGFKKSGTTVTSLAATDNVFSIDNNGTTIFLTKGNGDIHATNTSITALDKYDDVALLRVFQKTTTLGGMIKQTWDNFITYGRKELEAAGILYGDFYSLQGLNQLQVGGIIQNRTEIELLRSQIAQLKAQINGSI